MRSQAVASRYELFLASAALASHACAVGEGFRARDVRFYTELFTNWTEHPLTETIPLQNTQIVRYLEMLVTDGFIKKPKNRKPPTYALTRIGLLELAHRIVESKSNRSREHFLFALYFLRAYGERIQALVLQDTRTFSPALRIELAALLDSSALLKAEILRTDREVARLEQRVSDAEKTSETTRGRLACGVPFPDIVREIEKKYPYELNSQRPLHELIHGLVPDQRQWELEVGNMLRCSIMWNAQLEQARGYMRCLKGLVRKGE